MRPVKDEHGKVVALVPEAVEMTALRPCRTGLQQAQKIEIIGNLTGGIAHDFNNLLWQSSVASNYSANGCQMTPAFCGWSTMRRRARVAGLAHLAHACICPPAGSQARAHRPRAARVRHDRIDAAFVGPDDHGRYPNGPARLRSSRSDPNQLEAALLNLVVNARDAMHGKGRITVMGREERMSEGGMSGLKPGKYICLSVI